jgi:hypothetical protein
MAATQHVRRRAATALALWLAASGAALAQATPGAVFSAQPPPVAVESGALTQRGVPAEASAENAVVARERALANGQRLAWQRLAGTLGANPSASDSQIDLLVDSLVIEQERTTLTGYNARITVVFNAGRVQDFVAGRSVSRPASPGAPGPVVARIEAVSRHASLGEWLELRRRLAQHPQVARVEILALSTDAARLRLALRAAPALAAGELAAAGLAVTSDGGPGWRIALGPRS